MQFCNFATRGRDYLPQIPLKTPCGRNSLPEILESLLRDQEFPAPDSGQGFPGSGFRAWDPVGDFPLAEFRVPDPGEDFLRAECSARVSIERFPSSGQKDV